MSAILQNGNGLSPESTGDAANTPYLEIVEQPASKALRFRYECEGRSAGSIPGVHNTPENKTYPKIRIVGYHGRAVIVVSCVTKDEPYRAHPHNLVGKEGCRDGICTMEINNESMEATFSNLGIQCVKKKDIEDALIVREKKRVDPFRHGFTHRANASSIDLNAVRLCFQAFLPDLEPKKFLALPAVVSEPIFDKKAMSDLVITRLSHSSAPAVGGLEMILLCEKVAKEDIHVRFFEERNGQVVWEGLGDFSPNQVHKQVAIYFKTPPYHIKEVDQKVKVFIQLKRPSDGATSEPVPFHFISEDSGNLFPPRKRKRSTESLKYPSIIGSQASGQDTLYGHPVDSRFGVNFQPQSTSVKEEPSCASPVYGSPYLNATPGQPPYENQMPPQAINYPYGQSITLYPGNNPLPPFDNISNPEGSPSGSYSLMNPYPNPTFSNLPLGTFDEFVIENNDVSTPEHENSNRNNDQVLSIELKVDSRDLVHDNCQMDASVLSENFNQSLNLSSTCEITPNMSDSLTRLANETADKFQSLQQL